MRGLFVISSLTDGGAQRAMSNLLMGLPQGWDVDLLLNDNGKRDYPSRGNILSLGLPERKQKKSVSYQIRVLIRRYLMLKKLKRTKDYDFCISFLDSANLANVLTRRKGTAIILCEQNNLSEECAHSKAYKYLLSHLARCCYNRADRMIAVSEGVKEDLVRNYGVDAGRCGVVYNGVNLYSGEKHGRTGSDFVITTMGRLEEQKGQWHLIRVMASLAPRYPNLRLVILGEGTLRRRLEELAADLGVGDRVSMPGFVNHPLDIIADSDLFVFPSLYEGFGNALVEAMSCGVPVIASDFESGAREILSPDTYGEKKTLEEVEWTQYGCLVPVSGISMEDAGNMEYEDAGERGLRHAIEKMLNDKALYEEYSEKAVARAKDFTEEQMVRGWMEEIYQVCGKKV